MTENNNKKLNKKKILTQGGIVLLILAVGAGIGALITSHMAKQGFAKMMAAMNKETYITYSRCRRHYSILLSRISAYWRGALSADRNNENIPPMFDLNDSLLGIERRIETIKDIGEIND